MDKQTFIATLERRWATDARWQGIARPYTAEDVWRLRGTLPIEYTLASQGARRLWRLLHDEPYVAVLSALTGNQAVQEVKAGLPAIYVSGWQVAGDMNTALQTYPDQSMYPADSVPMLVQRINNALRRADQIHHQRGDDGIDWYVPIVADAEAGFGGVLNAYEIMLNMIEKGAAAVHFEDQLASLKKCGHLGGKVLVPTSEFVAKLVAARFAADVAGVETILIARTDALSATILANDIDPYDRPFIEGERTHEGFIRMRAGIDAAIARALAYNCSPSFNWRRHLTDTQIETFQDDLGALGYKFQFVTLSGFHALNFSMFMLAKAFCLGGMSAYSDLQAREFAAQDQGYEAIRHQEFAGTTYFDRVNEVASGGVTSTLGIPGSTESEQF